MWTDYRAQEELEIEYNSIYDDHHERYAGEALDAEYEAYCDEMNAWEEYAEALNAWDYSWPLEPAL